MGGQAGAAALARECKRCVAEMKKGDVDRACLLLHEHVLENEPHYLAACGGS